MEKLRTIRLAPYLKGAGPVWILTTWDTFLSDSRGKSILRYRMVQHENGKAHVLFQGEDFHCSPMYAIDSDKALASLLAFLTLRPGDTDPEYFEKYTEKQLAYCALHAESLSCYCSDRFGED